MATPTWRTDVWLPYDYRDTPEPAWTFSSNQVHLVAKLAQLKAILANKQELVAHLALVDNDAGHGFANVMAELSEFHQSGIRVNQVKLTPASVTLRGEALHAELVPQWLTGFEDASFLVGMRFADFSIHTNDDNITVFNVSTTASPESK